MHLFTLPEPNIFLYSEPAAACSMIYIAAAVVAYKQRRCGADLLRTSSSSAFRAAPVKRVLRRGGHETDAQLSAMWTRASFTSGRMTY